MTDTVAAIVEAAMQYDIIAEAIERAEMYTILMDIYLHSPITIDFTAMLHGREIDLVHDVTGMLAHWDSDTDTFRDCFQPRHTVYSGESN